MEIEELSDSRGFAEIAPEWDRLYARVAAATPFQSSAWLMTWWRMFGRGRLEVLLLRERGELAAIIPMWRAEASGSHYSFIGEGISDYLDGLFSREHSSAAAAAFLNYVQQNEEWAGAELTQLPGHSPLLHLQSRLALSCQVVPATSCFSVPLPESVEEWQTQMPRNLRQNLRYYQRRAEREGKITYEEASEKNLPLLIEWLFCLHAKRWQTRGQPGALNSDEIALFHREVAGWLLSRGELRLTALRFGGRVAAIAYAFVHHRRTFLYLTGMDPALADFSFGTQVLNAMIEAAIEEHCVEFDFLRGGEDYKRHFGATERPTFHLSIRRDTPAQSQAAIHTHDYESTS